MRLKRSRHKQDQLCELTFGSSSILFFPYRHEQYQNDAKDILQQRPDHCFRIVTVEERKISYKNVAGKSYQIIGNDTNRHYKATFRD